MGLAFISLIVCWHIFLQIGCANAAASFGLNAPAARQLSAATVVSGFHKRSAPISIVKHEASFDLFDAAGGRAASLDNTAFTANVIAKSETPILMLEDLESELESITCSASIIDFTIAS